MKLSIITVNLNNREGLQKTIDSVVSQTFKDFEWIVIDGGSTDGSRELIEQYADHLAYWISEPDKGIYNAMNKGIAHAKGEYIQFLNSGDWLFDRTALDRCFHHEFSADIVYGDLFFCTGEEKKRYQYPEHLNFRFLLNYSLGHPATFIKSVILKETPYDETLKIVADWKFFINQVFNNKGFEHIGEAVSCFDTSGISSNNESLVQSERDQTLKDVISPIILEDYMSMEIMDKELSNPQIIKVLEYGKKKKLYHKIITGAILFIELIERCHGKRKSLNHCPLL